MGKLLAWGQYVLLTSSAIYLSFLALATIPAFQAQLVFLRKPNNPF